jgi:hypothetical protein
MAGHQNPSNKYLAAFAMNSPALYIYICISIRAGKAGKKIEERGGVVCSLLISKGNAKAHPR